MSHKDYAWADSAFLEHRDEFREIWIAARTASHTTAETWIDLDNLPEVVRLQLRCGQDLAGRIEAGNTSLKGAIAILEPALPLLVDREYDSADPSMRQEFFKRETAPEPDGSFRFANVRCGQVYRLTVHAGPLRYRRFVPVVEAATPTVLAPFRLPKTGTITGRIFHPERGQCECENVDDNHECKLSKPRPWDFAQGNVSVNEHYDWGKCSRPISFTTDSNGRFTVKGVPAGWARVWVSYMMSADIMGSHARRVRVLPGRVSEIRMFDPSGKWDLPIEVTVGDGSSEAHLAGIGRELPQGNLEPSYLKRLAWDMARFDLQLSSLGNQPASPGGGLALSDVTPPTYPPGKHRYYVRDVSPGRWRLRAVSEVDPTGPPCFEKEINWRPGMKPVPVPLAPCSIVGETRDPIKGRYWGKLFTTTSGGGKLVREEDGPLTRPFVVSFHPEGRFDIMIHDEDRFCRVDNVLVKRNQIARPEIPVWQPGGVIRVKYALHGTLPRDPEERDARVTLIAVDTRGRRLDFPFADMPAFEGLVSPPYTLGGLWPDKWTVELHSVGEKVATAHVTLKGNETVECRLDYGEK